MDEKYISAFISFIAAESLLILLRQREILILAKKDSERTEAERNRCKHALLRSILLELVIFVPVSVTLVLLIIRPFAIDFAKAFADKSADHLHAFDATLGVISYGFPFATFRRVMVLVALTTIKQFASIASEHELSEAGDLRDRKANSARNAE